MAIKNWIESYNVRYLKTGQFFGAHMPYFRRPGHIYNIANQVAALLESISLCSKENELQTKI